MIKQAIVLKWKCKNFFCWYSISYSIIKYIISHLLPVLFLRHLNEKLICLLLDLNKCSFNSHRVF